MASIQKQRTAGSEIRWEEWREASESATDGPTNFGAAAVVFWAYRDAAHHEET